MSNWAKESGGLSGVATEDVEAEEEDGELWGVGREAACLLEEEAMMMGEEEGSRQGFFCSGRLFKYASVRR